MVKFFRRRQRDEEHTSVATLSSYSSSSRRPSTSTQQRGDRASINRRGSALSTFGLNLFPTIPDNASLTSSIEDGDSAPSLPLTRSTSGSSLLSLLEPASDDKERLARATEDMTINKLRFSSLGLIGRQKEVEQLQRAADQCRAEKIVSLVLIMGESGAGKTSLAKCLERQIRNDNQSIFISGKFDMLQRDNQPYAGIASACRELCGELLYRKKKNPKLLKKVEVSLGPIVVTLLKVVPELQEVFHLDEEAIRLIQTASQESSLQESKNQLNYAFRRLFDTLGIFFPGLVCLCLDDLQWADPASLELLELIIKDSDDMSLLVIGCYRLDEVDETHSLSMMVNRLKESKPSGTSKGVTRISEILVKNLGIMDVKEMLQELFSQDSDPALEKLAEICHSKSMGNAFHLTQLILTLHEKGLIEYNFGKLGWTWKVEEIKAKAPAAQNIVDLLKIKLNEQSDDVRKLLAVVSCMSSAAHEMLISKVWESIFQRDDPVCSAPLLQPLLAVALKEGFLEKSKAGSTYRFAHDKVSEAALSLMDQEELSTIKTMVGNALLSEHRLKHLPQHSLFIAVNLLNEGKSPQVNQESNLNLVKINLEVAQKATKASDFSSARRYVARAISLLPEEEKWSVKLYSISLELYSLGAEVEASLGHVDAMNAYCDEILKLKEASLSDKYRVHNVIQDSVLNSGDPDKALVLCLDLLKKLGHSFPRNEVTMLLATISKLLKIQKQVKRMTVHDIQKLPLLTNAEHLEAMYVLDKSSSCCYFNGSKLLPLVVMENYAITMKHGLGRYSPVAFAALSVMMSAILEDFEASAKLVQLIESIQAKLQFPNTTVRVNVILFQHTLPWFKPFQSLLKPAFDGYTLGLSGGDLESGFWFIHCYIGLGLQAGKRLQLLIADCQTYLKQMEETNFLLHAWYQKMVLRFLQELTGEEEPLIAVNTELYPEYEKCDIIQREILKLHKSRMCAIFADHARGAECTNNTAKLNPGTHFAISYPFFRAISLYHQARVTRKAKFRIQARKQHAIINRWAKKGNPNVIHYKLLLDAEAASLIKGMIGETSCLFQTAITLAARSGLTHDTALACERFATFLFYCGHDDSTANYQLNEALRYYQEWGAFAKVAMLQRDYPQLQDKLNTPSGEVLIPPGGELEA